MPAVAITTRRETADRRRPRHPKARIKVVGSDRELELPYAPTGGTLDGWADEWTTVERPGRRPLVVRNAQGLPTLALSFPLARRDHQADVETQLAKLRKIAQRGERVILSRLSPNERGPWRIDGVTINAVLRQHGTNHITRADVTLSLIYAVDADTKLGPVSGGKKKRKKGNSKARRYTIRKGDTLRSIAASFYGEPEEWRRIARRNKIKDPRRLKVGRTIVIPPDDKD